jgi:hypothetical protein
VTSWASSVWKNIEPSSGTRGVEHIDPMLFAGIEISRGTDDLQNAKGKHLRAVFCP